MYKVYALYTVYVYIYMYIVVVSTVVDDLRIGSGIGVHKSVYNMKLVLCIGKSMYIKPI